MYRKKKQILLVLALVPGWTAGLSTPRGSQQHGASRSPLSAALQAARGHADESRFRIFWPIVNNTRCWAKDVAHNSLQPHSQGRASCTISSVGDLVKTASGLLLTIDERYQLGKPADKNIIRFASSLAFVAVVALLMLERCIRNKRHAQAVSPIDRHGHLAALLRSIFPLPIPIDDAEGLQILQAGNAPLFLLLLQLGVSVFTLYVVAEPPEETDRVRVRRLSIRKVVARVQRNGDSPLQSNGVKLMSRTDVIRVAAVQVAALSAGARALQSLFCLGNRSVISESISQQPADFHKRFAMFMGSKKTAQTGDRVHTRTKKDVPRAAARRPWTRQTTESSATYLIFTARSKLFLSQVNFIIEVCRRTWQKL